MAKQNNKFKTSAEYAFELIREKITNGELEPGAKLTRRSMSALTGVSIIPVIEALQKLENEGLVISEPHYGTHVIELDTNTIYDRYAMRIAIECEVARILALRISEEQLYQLLFLSKELDTTERTEDPRGIFWTKHFNFHLKLAEYTEHNSFVRELKSLNLFEILRRSIQNMPMGPHTPVPNDHHQKIVEAIKTKDPDHAEKVMRDHLNYSGLVREENL